MPGFHAGRPPGNKGLRYPADPPKVEEIIAVMRAAGDDAHGRRLRAPIVILWRAGLRVQGSASARRGRSRSAPRRAASPTRQGRPTPRGRHGRLGLGPAPTPWLDMRLELPVGRLLCVINGLTRGRHWSSAAARVDLRRTPVQAGVRDASRPASSAMPTPSSSHARACRQPQLGHSNSASRRSTKASTMPR
jgi:hypothetical protein